MQGQHGTFPLAVPHGFGGAPSMSPPPDFVERVEPQGCNAQRVQLAGGALNTLLVHPEIVPFEQMYRILPEEGMFLEDVNPENPFTFNLGSFRVPASMQLLLTDLRPDIYRFSGVDPGDTMPVEARRFSSILGFDITINGGHPGNVLFQIDPVPATSAGVFAGAVGVNVENFQDLVAAGLNPFGRYDVAAASSFGSSSGAGQSMLPQRPQRYGPLGLPFTLYAQSGDVVIVRCIIFRPLPSPIAWIEYDVAGLLVPNIWMDSLKECMKPLTSASGGPGSLGPGPR